MDVLRALVQHHREALHDIDTRAFRTVAQIKRRLGGIRECVNNTPLKKMSLHSKGYQRLITENLLLHTKLYMYQTDGSNDEELRRALHDMDTAPRLGEKKRRHQAVLLLMIFYDRYTTKQLSDIVEMYNKLLSL